MMVKYYVQVYLTSVFSAWFDQLSGEEKAELYRGIGYDQNANIKKSQEVRVVLQSVNLYIFMTTVVAQW